MRRKRRIPNPENPCPPADTFDANPRPSMVSANVPCTSSHARTHREHTMHFAGSNVKYGIRFVLYRREMILAVVAVADLAQPDHACHVLQFAIAIRRARQAIQRMI